MFEWKIEDMSLMNEAAAADNPKKYVFKCESEVSREDKIAFVDSMNDGRLSYLLNLQEKFDAEKDSLPKDRFGATKTVSLKSWLKRNDPRQMVDTQFNYGLYGVLGAIRYIHHTYKNVHDMHTDFVDEAFHRQLWKCENAERAYFAEHDEYSILKNQLREKGLSITFGVHLAFWGSGKITIQNEDGTQEREITMEEIKELLHKHEQVEALIEKLTAETHITF